MNRACRSSVARFIAGLLSLWLVIAAPSVFSSTVSELQAAGRLQLRTSLSKVDNVVPGERIKLILEIATDRQFGGGTRIEVPEVLGLVILQTESFASNSSEIRKGVNWVVQRWSLDIYAQQEGTFTIPAISARIKISEIGDTTIEGRVTGPALAFSATRPESLRRAETWVASPSFSVTQSFDRDLDNVTVGDAIERKIRFEAEDVMAMMLPTFEEAQLNGVTRYADPPELRNSSNRGTTLAMREVTLTYIVEEQGEYPLPAQEYFWWDTQSNELELVSLPAVTIEVGNGSGKPSSDKKTDYRQIGFWIISALILLMSIVWLVKKLDVARTVNRVETRWNILQERWRKLRRPALPQTLNPGSSSED